MTFSTRDGPAMRHRVGAPPSNAAGTNGVCTSIGDRPAISSVKPGPSTSVIVRSSPTRSENGASSSSHANPAIHPSPVTISDLRPAPLSQRDTGSEALRIEIIYVSTVTFQKVAKPSSTPCTVLR